MSFPSRTLVIFAILLFALPWLCLATQKIIQGPNSEEFGVTNVDDPFRPLSCAEQNLGRVLCTLVNRKDVL